jgi:outer membrane protein
MKNLIKVALLVAGISLSGDAVQAQQKLAVINSNDLLQSMPEMKTADATLAEFQKKLQTQLEGMAAEREKKITAFTDKQKTLSEANKEAVNQELQNDYKIKSEEVFNPILKKATDAVNAVAKENGYTAVWDTSQPGIIYFEGLDNILEKVKTKLGITASAAPRATTTPAPR